MNLNEFYIKNEPQLDSRFFFLEIEKQNHINHRYDERRMRINEINQYGYYLDKQSQPKQNYENEFCIGNEPKLDTKFFYLEIERQNYINRRYDEHQKLINEIDPCEHYLDLMIKAENELIEDYLNSYKIEREYLNQLFEKDNYDYTNNFDLDTYFSESYEYYIEQFYDLDEIDYDSYYSFDSDMDFSESYEPFVEPFDDLDGIDYYDFEPEYVQKGNFEPQIEFDINYENYDGLFIDQEWELEKKLLKEEFNSKDNNENEFIKEYKCLNEKIESDEYINELYEEYLNSIVEDDIINEYKSLNEKIESDEYINELYEEYLNSINLDEFKY